MKTTMKRIRAAAAKAAVALAVALGLVYTAEAARNWTGYKNEEFSESNNWSGNGSGRRYFRNWLLDGMKITKIHLTKDVTEKSGNAGLCFDTPPNSSPAYWRFGSSSKDTIYTYDNSGATAYDTATVSIGFGGDSSKARFYAVNFKTKNLTIGGDASLGGGDIVKHDMTGYLILDDLDDDASSVWAPVNITASTCDFYKGSLYSTNANITCSGNMQLCNFTAEKSGGSWTVNGDLIIGNGGKTATITQKGGTFTVNSGKWTRFESGSTATLNLGGGTFATKRIHDAGAASASIVFDGGTLKANAYDSNGLIPQATINVTVKSGGAKVDASNYDVILNSAFNKDAEAAGDLTVTGGGSATFANMGDLAGALTVADGTGIHWFDQDGAVSATCTFTSLALGAGSTLYLDGDATGVDALPATAATTATAGNKANIVINFTAIPATGATFTLFPAASADVFNVSPMFGSLVLPNEVAVVDGYLVMTIVAEDYTWNGTGTNWGDADAWTKGGAAATWADGNNAIFNTASATATLAANASSAKIDFTADATVNGAATLTVPSVSVAQGVTATVTAPTAGAIEKKGAGALAIGASRTEQTTVTEGTLKVLSGATVAPAKLTLGTDAAKPVALDYDGQTLSTDLSAAANRYMAPGMDVTLTNGVFHTTVNPAFDATTAPNVFTIAKDATFRSAGNFTWNASYDANVDSDTTVNISGGQMISQNSGYNNWFMQDSRRGKLRFNVTDGGLFQTGGQTYIMTCRDSTTAADTPEMYMMFSNSTFRVANNKTLSIGYDGSNKNPLEPKFSLAMTNSVLDVGTGIINLGHNVVGENTAGFYTADFVDSVISAKCFKVFHDRHANSARFDNSTLVLTATDSWSIGTDENFGPSSTPMTIGAGGLTIDTQTFNCNLQADPQGEGAIVKKGSGTLVIQRDQTSSGALNVNEGTLALGASVATLSRPLSFADGTTLDVAGGAPVAITSIALPASGVVTLLKGGSAFAKGVYRIFSGNVAAADVQDRLVPSTGGEVYSWMVKDGVLLLNVGNLPGNAWTGFAGDGKMSTDANWLDGTAPVAGEALDFSGVTAAATIEGDIDAALGAVTMGSGVVTFTGSLTATSFSDTSKIAVGENSTVTLDGDLDFSNTADVCIVNTVATGGRFVVTGVIRQKSDAGDFNLLPCATAGEGAIVAKGLSANKSTYFRLVRDGAGTYNWIVGSDGVVSGNSGIYWLYANSNNPHAIIKPLDSDFPIAAKIAVREHAILTLVTTGEDGNPHTITLGNGSADYGIYREGTVNITGTGKVVANYNVSDLTSTASQRVNPFVVTDTATLAIKAGKQITTGAITVNSDATLALPETGTVAMGGSLTLAARSTLEFTLSAAGQTTLDVTGKKLTLPAAEADPVVVSLGVKPNAAVRSKTPYTLISGANLTGDDLAKFTLGANPPEWVASENALVVEDGDLKLYTMNPGLCIKIK